MLAQAQGEGSSWVTIMNVPRIIRAYNYLLSPRANQGQSALELSQLLCPGSTIALTSDEFHQQLGSIDAPKAAAFLHAMQGLSDHSAYTRFTQYAGDHFTTQFDDLPTVNSPAEAKKILGLLIEEKIAVVTAVKLLEQVEEVEQPQIRELDDTLPVLEISDGEGFGGVAAFQKYKDEYLNAISENKYTWYLGKDRCDTMPYAMRLMRKIFKTLQIHHSEFTNLKDLQINFRGKIISFMALWDFMANERNIKVAGQAAPFCVVMTTIDPNSNYGIHKYVAEFSDVNVTMVAAIPDCFKAAVKGDQKLHDIDLKRITDNEILDLTDQLFTASLRLGLPFGDNDQAFTTYAAAKEVLTWIMCQLSCSKRGDKILSKVYQTYGESQEIYQVDIFRLFHRKTENESVIEQELNMPLFSYWGLRAVALESRYTRMIIEKAQGENDWLIIQKIPTGTLVDNERRVLVRVFEDYGGVIFSVAREYLSNNFAKSTYRDRQLQTLPLANKDGLYHELSLSYERFLHQARFELDKRFELAKRTGEKSDTDDQLLVKENLYKHSNSKKPVDAMYAYLGHVYGKHFRLRDQDIKRYLQECAGDRISAGSDKYNNASTFPSTVKEVGGDGMESLVHYAFKQRGQLSESLDSIDEVYDVVLRFYHKQDVIENPDRLLSPTVKILDYHTDGHYVKPNTYYSLMLDEETVFIKPGSYYTGDGLQQITARFLNEQVLDSMEQCQSVAQNLLRGLLPIEYYKLTEAEILQIRQSTGSRLEAVASLYQARTERIARSFFLDWVKQENISIKNLGSRRRKISKQNDVGWNKVFKLVFHTVDITYDGKPYKAVFRMQEVLKALGVFKTKKVWSNEHLEIFKSLGVTGIDKLLGINVKAEEDLKYKYDFEEMDFKTLASLLNHVVKHHLDWDQVGDVVINELLDSSISIIIPAKSISGLILEKDLRVTPKKLVKLFRRHLAARKKGMTNIKDVDDLNAKILIKRPELIDSLQFYLFNFKRLSTISEEEVIDLIDEEGLRGAVATLGDNPQDLADYLMMFHQDLVKRFGLDELVKSFVGLEVNRDEQVQKLRQQSPEREEMLTAAILRQLAHMETVDEETLKRIEMIYRRILRRWVEENENEVLEWLSERVGQIGNPYLEKVFERLYDYFSDYLDFELPESLLTIPYPYQLEAMRWFSSKDHKRGLLADEPGMGKSYQATGIVETIKAKKALWVTTNSNKESVRKEVLKRTTIQRDQIAVLNSENLFYQLRGLTGAKDIKLIRQSLHQLKAIDADLYEVVRSSIHQESDIDFEGLLTGTTDKDKIDFLCDVLIRFKNEDEDAYGLMGMELAETQERVLPSLISGVDSRKYFIINYEALRELKTRDPKGYANLMAGVDIMFADEGQVADNEESQQGEAIHQMAQEVDRFIILSATPIQNRFERLYNQLHLIDAQRFPMSKEDKKAFMERYTKRGFEGLLELHHLMQRYMLRRTKKGTFNEADPDKLLSDQKKVLPKKINVPPEVKGGFTMSWTQAKYYAQVIEDYEGFIDEHYSHLEEEERAAMKSNSLTKLDILFRIVKYPNTFGIKSNPRIAELRRHVIKTLEDGGKPIIWAHHQEAITEIIEMLDGISAELQQDPQQLFPNGFSYGRYDGSSEATKKVTYGIDGIIAQREIDLEQFQKSVDSNPRVMVASLAAGGVGLTMTAGDQAFFYEQPWIFTRIIQAEDRNHRVDGRFPRHRLDYYRLIAQFPPGFLETVEDEELREKLSHGTVDEILMKKIEAKIRQFGVLFDGLSSDEELSSQLKKDMMGDITLTVDQSHRDRKRKRYKTKRVQRTAEYAQELQAAYQEYTNQPDQQEALLKIIGLFANGKVHVEDFISLLKGMGEGSEALQGIRHTLSIRKKYYTQRFLQVFLPLLNRQHSTGQTVSDLLSFQFSDLLEKTDVNDQVKALILPLLGLEQNPDEAEATQIILKTLTSISDRSYQPYWAGRLFVALNHMHAVHQSHPQIDLLAVFKRSEWQSSDDHKRLMIESLYLLSQVSPHMQSEALQDILTGFSAPSEFYRDLVSRAWHGVLSYTDIPGGTGRNKTVSKNLKKHYPEGPERLLAIFNSLSTHPKSAEELQRLADYLTLLDTGLYVTAARAQLWVQSIKDNLVSKAGIKFSGLGSFYFAAKSFETPMMTSYDRLFLDGSQIQSQKDIIKRVLPQVWKNHTHAISERYGYEVSSVIERMLALDGEGLVSERKLLLGFIRTQSKEGLLEEESLFLLRWGVTDEEFLANQGYYRSRIVLAFRWSEVLRALKQEKFDDAKLQRSLTRLISDFEVPDEDQAHDEENSLLASLQEIESALKDLAQSQKAVLNNVAIEDSNDPELFTKLGDFHHSVSNCMAADGVPYFLDGLPLMMGTPFQRLVVARVEGKIAAIGVIKVRVNEHDRPVYYLEMSIAKGNYDFKDEFVAHLIRKAEHSEAITPLVAVNHKKLARGLKGENTELTGLGGYGKMEHEEAFFNVHDASKLRHKARVIYDPFALDAVKLHTTSGLHSGQDVLKAYGIIQTTQKLIDDQMAEDILGVGGAGSGLMEIAVEDPFSEQEIDVRIVSYGARRFGDETTWFRSGLSLGQ